VASMEDRFSAEIVEVGWAHQKCTFLCSHYESTGQSTFLAAIHQEQLLRQGHDTIDAFFDQLFVVWRQIDTLGPQLSLATCQSCKDQKTTLELCRTYDFLTRLRGEFEPLRTQLLAPHPCFSLMDALAEVRNEETHLQDVGLLRAPSAFAARSSITRPAAPMPTTSPPVASSAACGVSTGLHCDHCGRDGHVEAFFYRKKKTQKAQARRSSHDTGGSSSGGYVSFAGSETQELLKLLRRLATSTSTGAVDPVTQPSVLTGSATTS
jgi:hypothetical protein